MQKHSRRIQVRGRWRHVIGEIGDCYDSAQHRFLLGALAILELGVGTSGTWRQIFGFGPGALTASSRRLTSTSPPASSRGVIPACPANQDPAMSVIPTPTHRPPTFHAPVELKECKITVLLWNFLVKSTGGVNTTRQPPLHPRNSQSPQILLLTQIFPPPVVGLIPGSHRQL